MRRGDMPFWRIPRRPMRSSFSVSGGHRADYSGARHPRRQPVPSSTRSVDSEQQSGGSKAEALLSRNAHTENLRSAAMLSYVVDSATSAHTRHNLSAAGGRLVTSTRASPMEHTTALRRSDSDARRLRPAAWRTQGDAAGRARADGRWQAPPMYTCSGCEARSKVAPRSVLDTSVSEGAQRAFPVDVHRPPPEARRGFLVVDSTNPRHLWGSDERIFSVSHEGSAMPLQSLPPQSFWASFTSWAKRDER
jgi:hypothetical protein